jgi:hypothetical protein
MNSVKAKHKSYYINESYILLMIGMVVDMVKIDINIEPKTQE